MKNIKRFGAVFLVFAMLFTTVITACADEYENKFSDVSENAWYAEAVRYCDENGLMTGMSETSFSPRGTMTRAMFAAALYRQAGSPAVSGSDAFTDTADGQWYSSAVLWASQQEIITGYGDRFGTNDPVTREQLVTMLWRRAGSPQTAADEKKNEFADQASIADYAADAVSWASANKIVSGKNGNIFDPKGNAERAEVAMILMNIAKSPFGEQGGADNPSLPAQSGGSSGGGSGSSGGSGGSGNSGGGSGSSDTGSKVLIAYFSATNNTENIANHIKTVLENDNIDADIYEIVPQEPYTSEDLNYSNNSCRANREQNDDSARPAISGTVSDMSKYDAVFLGYPIWWGQAPKIMYTFAESYDFSGKTIVPFCTSGSSGIGTSAVNLQGSASGASWVSGQRFSGGASVDAVESWVKGLEIYGTLLSKDTQGADKNDAEDIKLKIKVNGAQEAEWTAVFADNSSADALKELLSQGDITIDMHDYGNFEKVGALGHTLPRNDENITTQAGDIILYQGNQVTIYYDTNTYSFTRLCKIEGVTQDEMKSVLGSGNVTVTLSIK